MKKFLFLILSFAATAFGGKAQETNRREDVNNLISRLFDGFSSLDTNGIRQCLTADFLLLENGETANADTIMHRLGRVKKEDYSRTNRLDFIQTEVRNNTAWLAYHNHADIIYQGQPGKVDWLESAVLVKEKNGWKIRMLHSTRLTPKPE